NDANNVTPQDGDGLTLDIGEQVAADDGEVDLAGREGLQPRFWSRHLHDLQAHAGMFVRQGPHEGGDEFLAEVGHGPGSNAEGQITKVEPYHAGPEPEQNQETGDDHQTHSPSVLRHCFPPSMSSHHGGHKAHGAIYHSRPYWIPGSYAPTLSKKRTHF